VLQNAVFITGTGTDVGKTIVAAGILRYLRRAGLDAVSMKPVQTGAERDDDRFIAPDLVVHHAAAKLAPNEDELALMAPYIYEPACSPHLAGRLAGNYPDIEHIAGCAAKLCAQHDCVLIEGAGGILVPLDEVRTMLDLMVRLGCPVILAATRGLGTINHTLLSIQSLRDAGLNLLGVVFDETEPVERDFIRQDNPEAVRKFGKVDILGDVDYLEGFDPNSDATWERFDRCMPGLPTILQSIPKK
jgi:dethiobiotin synthase